MRWTARGEDGYGEGIRYLLERKSDGIWKTLAG
jgi:hypothetical protein